MTKLPFLLTVWSNCFTLFFVSVYLILLTTCCWICNSEGFLCYVTVQYYFQNVTFLPLCKYSIAELNSIHNSQSVICIAFPLHQVYHWHKNQSPGSNFSSCLCHPVIFQYKFSSLFEKAGLYSTSLIVLGHFASLRHGLI